MTKKRNATTSLATIESLPIDIGAELEASAIAEVPDILIDELPDVVLTDEELETIGDEPTEEPVQEPDGQSDETQAEEDEPQLSFAEIIEGIDQQTHDEGVVRVLEAFDARDAFERSKGGHYDSISKSLNKYRGKLSSSAAVDVLIAAQVDPGFVHRSLSAKSGYNVYAIDKVADIVAALSHGLIKNQINAAIIATLFNCRDAGVAFTGEIAKACASKDLARKVDANVRKLLISHIVSASTAPTQASSSMAALQTLGVVTNTGSQKAPVYVLTDTPQTRRLEEVVRKAA